MLTLLKFPASPYLNSVGSIVDFAEAAESVQTAEGFRAAREFVFWQSTEADILSALTSEDALFRRKALGLLIYWGTQTGMRTLIDALREDPCPIVRHEAAFYMAFWGHDEFVVPLCDALLRDPEPLVRHEAAEALGDMGASEAKGALEVALLDSSDVVVRTVRIALVQLDAR
jgi:HEAT repeat protein